MSHLLSQVRAFTPTITAASTAGTPAYTTQVGEFVLAGSMVYFNLKLVLSGWTGSPSGAISVELPSIMPLARSKNSLDHQLICKLTNQDLSGNVPVNAVISSGSRSIVIDEQSDNSTRATISPDAGATIEISGWYFRQ